MRRADAPPPAPGNRGARAPDEALSRELTAALDREVDALDAATLGRLRAARRTALDRAGRRRVRPGIGARGLGGAVATAALVVALWTTHPGDAPQAPVVASTPSSLEGLPVLSAGDDLEFYRSVDFLMWLESRPERG